MNITGKTKLSTVEIEVFKIENFWEVSVMAYGEWIVNKFKSQIECVEYIESYFLLSKAEKKSIKNLEELK